MAKLIFLEIILIWQFGAQETSIITINVENSKQNKSRIIWWTERTTFHWNRNTL